VVGIQVLESKETPGLGDKIETDPDFLRNFERLDVALAEDGSGLANRVVAVRTGEKEHPWEVDGITGATISSVAIAAILDGSAQTWAPRIQRGLDDLRGGE
jgi:electron transport complex protein RnfG